MTTALGVDRPALVRVAGIVHSRLSTSISAQVALTASPERTAVKAMNSSARAATPTAGLSRAISAGMAV